MKLLAKMMIALVCCSALIGIAAAVHGNLTRDEKQIYLDFHNYYRKEAGATNMRRMVWF